jgi:hypothetical protein
MSKRDDDYEQLIYSHILGGGSGGLGPELIINGGFNDASAWNLGTAAVELSSGVAIFTNEGAGLDSLYEIGITPTGISYQVVFTITEFTSGSIRYQFGNQQAGTLRNAVGTYTQTTLNNPAVGNANFIFKAGSAGTTLKIDNVSVRRSY